MNRVQTEMSGTRVYLCFFSDGRNRVYLFSFSYSRGSRDSLSRPHLNVLGRGYRCEQMSLARVVGIHYRVMPLPHLFESGMGGSEKYISVLFAFVVTATVPSVGRRQEYPMRRKTRGVLLGIKSININGVGETLVLHSRKIEYWRSKTIFREHIP